ncbi:MAG: ATP-binding cassette domain-containing protein [Clostridiales bacterium]|nr:ATP-binding cassette domain-containing protein [Clostridiales bacterium]
MTLQVSIQKNVKSFSLNVEFETSGGCTGILGASGCGKSMTLKCIAGIEKPDKGRIVLNGRVLFDSDEKVNLPPQQRKVGYLFQDYALFPNMTVAKNIAAALRLPKKDKEKKVGEMVKFFHLEGLEGSFPGQLSGGQQQRVALARIMAYEPDVLMLDEPFSALDTYLKEQLQMQVRSVLKTYHGDVLLVTHDRDEVYRFCDKVLVMDKGSIVNIGHTKDVFRRPDNVISARLSGCKNISKAKKISDYKVLALDWGIILQTANPITEDVRYIGIRAHDLKPVNAPKASAVNVFRCVLVELVEGPFEVDIILSGSGERDIPAENTLWCKVGKDEWKMRLEERVPQYLSVSPEDIMLLRA